MAQHSETCQKRQAVPFAVQVSGFRGRGGIPISIVIADDHALTVGGTRAAIEAMHEFKVVGTAGNGIEAIAQIKRLSPDCAVLDLVMPGASGLEVLLEARRWSPKTKIAIVTGSPSAKTLRRLIEAGAAGLFLKSGAVEELCQGLRDIVAGRTVVGAGVTHCIAQDAANDSLTRRETEVLQCIARGLSNNGIAEHLGISAKTVDNHRTNLMRKLEVHSTATLLVRAMRDGLVEP
ncbi:LuxR C-terminal-related transcriptional regulator [Nitratireductor arenosus]|uniref:LuxR C-terminal-related transcriptional regulator n=1 Tax=Nitratireductor arenosus TaxID=2682096 RepID=UPI0018D22AD0|nr:response regulator transcription factor [Nitratireductor arenosus]